jgi:hypothetical protein
MKGTDSTRGDPRPEDSTAPRIAAITLDDLIPMAVECVEAAIKFHEFTEHGRAFCHEERVNVVAFIAHRLGASPEAVVRRMAEYKANHEAPRERGH